MSEIGQLLRDYAAKTISRRELLKQLVSGRVVIIASYSDAKDPAFNIQDYIYQGKSYIPLFSDTSTASRLLTGAKFNSGMGYINIKANYLVTMFAGPEWLIINAGDDLMVEMYAHELKPFLSSTLTPPVTETQATGLNGLYHVLTEPTQMKIGKPSRPPSAEALLEMREAAASTEARLVYWFWMSISDGRSHLGLAVSPSDEAIIRQIGEAIEPIWLKHRPDNSLIDILPLDTAGLLEILRTQGQVLYGGGSNSSRSQATV